MWFSRQKNETQAKFKSLVKNGQFEIANGAWTDPDEATSNYEDIIEDLTLGHQWLRTQLDFVPKIGWNLLSKGHTSTYAHLLSAFNYTAAFVKYIDQDMEA